MYVCIRVLFFIVAVAYSSSLPSIYKSKAPVGSRFITPSVPSRLSPRAPVGHRLTKRACDNSASDRSCWGDYDTSTDYYDEVPDTGETKPFWLEISNTTLSPDGVERIVLTVNGTIPGPTLEVNWGDTVVIHVTNSMQNNGSGIHWHGIRQNYTNQMDGVPSVTQCPIAVCNLS